MTSPESLAHKPLRQDIKLLGRILGEVISRCESPRLLAQIEELRTLSKQARAGNHKAYLTIERRLSALNHEEQTVVARGFTEFLRLSNLAEQFHRIRRRRQYEADRKSPQPGSLARLFDGASRAEAKELLRRLGEIELDLVFTAHPTEAMRPSAIQRYREIADYLDVLSRAGSSPAQKGDALAGIERAIFALWKTDLFREHAPTPLDEVVSGFSVIEDEVWPTIPQLMRKLNFYHERYLGCRLPLHTSPIRLSSWMGGDRDGNPNVTFKVTRRVLNHSLYRAASLYLSELNRLVREFPYSFEDSILCEKYKLKSREPYRELFERQVAKLEAVKKEVSEKETLVTPFFDSLLEALNDISESLIRQKCEPIARGRLEDLIRRAYVFGPSLLRLDIRQERKIHGRVVGEILAPQMDYGALSPEQKLGELKKRAFAPIGAPLDRAALSAEAQELLNVMGLIKEYPRGCFGSYVISMAESASDVLEVLFLQRLVGIKSPLPIAPLFETPPSLDKSEQTLRDLYEIPEYRKLIGGSQNIMLGYSDSTKRAGKFASSWVIYKKQLEISRVSGEFGIEPIFFHGRGGTIGRGGGPISLALKGLPGADTLRRLRITEQGESVHAKFGLPEIALRTFELYLTGLLEPARLPSASKIEKWSGLMDKMAAESAAAFRKLVYETPDFLRYYAQVTPAAEISDLTLSSRPSKRKGASDFESLRAIPWVFSWTQNRLLVASWYGVLQGLDAGDLKTLRDMYQQWPFFAASLDLIEMVLGKVDLTVSKVYSERLVAPELRSFTDDLTKDYDKTVARLLAVVGHRGLLEHNQVLKRSILVRNPYVQVLNVLQVFMLASARDNESTQAREALAVTISGISAGMKNTG